jgi:hypothetical protein
MKMKEKNRLKNTQGLDYIDYINNEAVLYNAKEYIVDSFIRREYKIDNPKANSYLILKGDCRTLIEAVNNLPYMLELNLGLFQKDIDELYGVLKCEAIEKIQYNADKKIKDIEEEK